MKLCSWYICMSLCSWYICMFPLGKCVLFFIGHHCVDATTALSGASWVWKIFSGQCFKLLWKNVRPELELWLTWSEWPLNIVGRECMYLKKWMISFCGYRAHFRYVVCMVVMHDYITVSFHLSIQLFGTHDLNIRLWWFANSKFASQAPSHIHRQCIKKWPVITYYISVNHSHSILNVT